MSPVSLPGLKVAVGLAAVALMSACWCSPGAAPSPEAHLPAGEEEPVAGSGLEVVPDDPSAPGVAAPAATPQTFVIRIPDPAGTPTPDATAPAPGLGTPFPPPPSPTPFPLIPPPAGPTATPAPPPAPPPAGPPVGAPGLAPQATTAPPSHGPVDITLAVDPAPAALGPQFSVNIVVYAGPSRPVDAVQVYLDFDVRVLEVVDITAGTALSWQLQADFDSQQGRVSYAAGTLEGPLTAPFVLATVDFRAIAPTGPGGTALHFAPPTPPRHTRVAVGPGLDVTGHLTPLIVVVQ